MSDFPQGAHWWKASDGRWYPPDVPSVESAGEDPAPPPEPDGGWSTAAGQGDPTKQGSSSAAGCFWLIAAIVGVSVLLGMCGSGDDGADDPENLRFGAFDVCTQFVEDQLKAPGTASFRNFFEDDGEVTVTGAGEGPYTVRSTVDAENSFGASIRSNFVCQVRHTGDGNWRLIDLSID